MMKAASRIRAFVLLAALAIAGIPAAAQTRPAGDPGVLLKRIETAVGQLDLSDGQRGQVDKILKQGADDITNAGPDLQNASPEDKAAKYREIFADVREQVAGVLTDDQKQQLRDKMQSLRNTSGDAIATSAPAANVPASQPATIARAGNGNGMGRAGQGRGAQMLQRFKDALAQLDLTDDQKNKTDAVLEDMTTQLRQIRQGVRSGNTSRDDVREKVVALLQETLPKLGEILTPEQRTTLRSIMQASGGPNGGGPNGGPNGGGNGRRQRVDDTKTPTTVPSTAPAALPPGTVNAGDASAPTGVAVATSAPDLGQPAPDFQLKKINGESTSLADARHHVLALIFASASAPAFRDHAAGLNALHEKYATRGVEFLVIYTKEQHPVGGWELQRNKDDNINIPLARTAADREKAARQLHDALHLAEWVAVDSMDDHVAAAYGVNQTVPAFVIDRDGNIAFHQSWLEPDTLGHALDDALSNTH